MVKMIDKRMFWWYGSFRQTNVRDDDPYLDIREIDATSQARVPAVAMEVLMMRNRNCHV